MERLLFTLFHVDCEMVVLIVRFNFIFILFLTTFFLLKGGKTALHAAAYRGSEQIVKILLEHGSNVHLQDTVFIFFFDFDFLFLCFFSFFLFVVVCGVHCWGLFQVDCEMVVLIVIYLILNSFLKTTFFLLKYGWTALHFAALRGFEQTVKILIEHRSNINIQNKVLIFFFFFF